MTSWQIVDKMTVVRCRRLHMSGPGLGRNDQSNSTMQPACSSQTNCIGGVLIRHPRQLSIAWCADAAGNTAQPSFTASSVNRQLGNLMSASNRLLSSGVPAAWGQTGPGPRELHAQQPTASTFRFPGSRTTHDSARPSSAGTTRPPSAGEHW